MTKTEAVAVNNVVAHLIGMKGVLSHLDTAATFDSALHSAALLADSAHKSLGTGLTAPTCGRSGTARGLICAPGLAE